MRTATGLILASALAAAFIGACGGDDEADDATSTTGTPTTTGSGASGGGGGAGGGTGGTGNTGGEFVPTCMPTPGKIFGLNKLLLGDTLPDGTEDDNAWRQYGFDVDGKTTTPASMDVCNPSSGGSTADAYPDGDNGIDNSFGRNVLPLFKTFSPNLSTDLNKNIAGGGFTMMLRMDDLARGPDTPSLETLVYAGAGLGSVPKFDGTDCWPVVQEALSDPMDIDSTPVVLAGSSVTADLWTSGAPGTLSLKIPVASGTLNLIIHAARLSMTLDADHGGATVGLLGGVLETEQFVAEVEKLAGGISTAYCEGPIIETIVNQIRQKSDIMKDGSQNPNATCDGISIGLGFTAKAVVLGGIHPKVTPPPDPCAM